MDKERNDRDLKKYADDIAVIKSLLLKVDEKPLIEYWAFFTWAGLILTGTLIHYVLRRTMQLDISAIFLKVWLPVFLAGFFFETLAWIRKMNREAVPLLSRPMIKMAWALVGLMTGLGFIYYLVVRVSSYAFIPYLILVTFGIFMVFFAQISYQFYFGFGYFYMLLAIVLYLFELDGDSLFTVTGMILGITFAVAGLVTRRREKEVNDH